MIGVSMIMIAFITVNSGLVPLIEGLCAQAEKMNNVCLEKKACI